MELKHYKLLGEIGTGSYSKVYLAESFVDNKQYIVKKINFSHLMPKEMELLLSEIKNMERFDNPFIVKFYETQSIGVYQYHVLEYCNGGDLYQFMMQKKNAREHFSENDIVRWSFQILTALKDIHAQNIIHRDLKPENIFLVKLNNEINVKVGDFGLSRELKGREFARTIAGTPLYMAPELVQNEKYSSKVDIWSLGCILYELCTFVPAFNGSEYKNIMSKIVNKSLVRIPLNYSNSLQELISKILTREPLKRPNAIQLLSLPIFRNCITKQMQQQKTNNLHSNQVKAVSSMKSHSQNLQSCPYIKRDNTKKTALTPVIQKSAQMMRPTPTHGSYQPKGSPYGHIQPSPSVPLSRPKPYYPKSQPKIPIKDKYGNPIYPSSSNNLSTNIKKPSTTSDSNRTNKDKYTFNNKSKQIDKSNSSNYKNPNYVRSTPTNKNLRTNQDKRPLSNPRYYDDITKPKTPFRGNPLLGKQKPYIANAPKSNNYINNNNNNNIHHSSNSNNNISNINNKEDCLKHQYNYIESKKIAFIPKKRATNNILKKN